MPHPAMNLRLPPDVREWLRTAAATDDISLTEVVSRLVRSHIEGSASLRQHFERPRGRVCPGCGMSRDPRPEYAVHDSIAHAQCDQRLAAIEEGAK